MANLPKAVQLLAKLLEQYMAKKKNLPISNADVISKIATDPKSAKVWNSFPQAIKKSLLKKWGVSTAHDKGIDIMINGNADQLKTYITKTPEGRKWIQVVDKKGFSGAGKQYTNRSFAAHAAGKAAELAATMALVYAIDEGIETLQNIPGVGYVLNQTSIGPWLLQDAIIGAIPGVGDVMNKASHGMASFFAGILDFIGLDGMANWLKEYNRVYEDKQLEKETLTKQRDVALSNVLTALKGIPTADGTSDLLNTLQNDGLKAFLKESVALSKANDRPSSDDSSIREDVSIWVSDLGKRV